MQITLSRNELLASLLFASRDGARLVLNGVLIETFKSRPPILVSTDGRRLTVIESTTREPAQGKSHIVLGVLFIQRICSISAQLTRKPERQLIALEFEPDKQAVKVDFLGCGCRMEFDSATVFGIYPNWRGVRPDKKQPREQMNEVAFNAAYFRDYVKAASLLGSDDKVLRANFINSTTAIEVLILKLPQFYSIIMPCTIASPSNFNPEFLALE